MSGAKDIENRTWSTDYRGPVILQASASKTGVNFIVKEKGLPALGCAYGALVGVADLVDVVALNEALEANPWAQGTHCWQFKNARVFREPIPLMDPLISRRSDCSLFPSTCVHTASCSIHAEFSLA